MCEVTRAEAGRARTCGSQSKALTKLKDRVEAASAGLRSTKTATRTKDVLLELKGPVTRCFMTLSRTENMARIRSQNTRPERLLYEALVEAGVPVERHLKTPHCRPDLVIADRQIAIFVDGCFWHGCPKHYVRPGSREDFWAERLRMNVERDRRQTLAMEQAGWTVVRIWEHEVFTELPVVVARVLAGCVSPSPATTSPVWRVVRVDVIDPTSRMERRHMVDLRNPAMLQEIEGQRQTTQWRRSRSQNETPEKHLPRDPDARP